MIEKAIEHLKNNGVTAFELSGVLVIPVSFPSDIEPTVRNIKRLLKEINYNKSWAVDPYYYEKRGKIEHTMFGDSLAE